MFSVRLSITAETMKLSVNSSVLLLTRYDTDFLALSRLSSKSFLTSIAVFKSMFTENVEDNNIINKIKNNTSLNKKITYKTYNKMLTTIVVAITKRNPDSLFLIFIKIFLKKLMIEPIITTGWIFVGSSPNVTSIASENNNANIIK